MAPSIFNQSTNKKIFEIILPVAFAAILVAIKNASLGEGETGQKEAEPSVIYNNTDVMRILSFSDYVTAILAKRQCLMIPGTFPSRASWLCSLLGLCSPCGKFWSLIVWYELNGTCTHKALIGSPRRRSYARNFWAIDRVARISNLWSSTRLALWCPKLGARLASTFRQV